MRTQRHAGISAFRLSAWCRRPDLIPPALDLFIPDPAPDIAEPLPEKLGLLYPVDVKLVAIA
jgi:hypothetical protein